jgi:hypothetical protein
MAETMTETSETRKAPKQLPFRLQSGSEFLVPANGHGVAYICDILESGLWYAALSRTSKSLNLYEREPDIRSDRIFQLKPDIKVVGVSGFHDRYTMSGEEKICSIEENDRADLRNLEARAIFSPHDVCKVNVYLYAGRGYPIASILASGGRPKPLTYSQRLRTRELESLRSH